MSKVFVDHLRERIARKQNAVVLITGDPGIGKSWAALYLAEALDPSFSVHKIAFSMKELSYIIFKLNPRRGESIMIDEASIALDNRLYRSNENIMGTRLLTTLRRRLNYIFFTAPASSHIDKKVKDLANFMIQIDTRNDAVRRTEGEIKQIQHNTIIEKNYSKNLKAEFTKYPRHIFYAPSPKLAEDYEKLAELMKTQNEKEIFENFHEQQQEYMNLTDLQREVLQGKKLGMRTKDIAQMLGKRESNIAAMVGTLRKRGILKRSNIIEEKVKKITEEQKKAESASVG